MEHPIAPHLLILGDGIGALAACVESLLRGVRTTWARPQRPAHTRIVRRGFTFLPAPVAFTLPGVFLDLAARAGVHPGTCFPLVPTDEDSAFIFPDGARIRLGVGARRNADLLEQQLPGTDAGARYRQLLERSRPALDALGAPGVPPPTAPPPSKASRPAHQRPDEAQRIFDHLAGASPGAPPTRLYLPAAIADTGLWTTPCGVEALTIGLEQLAAQLGVHFVHAGPAPRVRVEAGRTTGADLGDTPLAADAVLLCDAPVVLCDAQGGPTHRETGAPDLGVVCLGFTGPAEHLASHSVLFSSDPAREHEDLFVRGVFARDPTVELWTTSRLHPRHAPAGATNLTALVRLPPHARAEATDLRPVMLGAVLDALRKTGLSDLNARLRAEHSFIAPRPPARTTAEPGTRGLFVPDATDDQPACRALAGLRAARQAIAWLSS